MGCEMKFVRLTGILAATTLFAGLVCAQAPQQPKRKRVLVIGEVKGYQHDSVSYAMAKIWN